MQTIEQCSFHCSNDEASSWNMMLDGTMCPSQKLVHFVLREKKNIFLCNGVFHLSNCQKVQLNTDLFSDKQKYLYTNQRS